MSVPHADRDGSERVSYHHPDDGPWPYTAVLTTGQPDQPLPARLWQSIERLDVHDTRTQGLLATIRHLETMLADATAECQHERIAKTEYDTGWTCVDEPSCHRRFWPVGNYSVARVEQPYTKVVEAATADLRAEVGRLRKLYTDVAGGARWTTQIGGALVSKCDTYGLTDVHRQRDAALATVRSLETQLAEADAKIRALKEEAAYFRTAASSVRGACDE